MPLIAYTDKGVVIKMLFWQLKMIHSTQPIDDATALDDILGVETTK